MTFIESAITLLLSFALSLLLTNGLIGFCLRRRILAIPNSRSNHTVSTPVGGGIAIVVSFFIGCLPLIMKFSGSVQAPSFLFLALAVLCIVSFQDDISHVSIWARLATHTIAASLGAMVVQAHGSISNGLLNTNIEFILIVFFIVGFINICNFMDGIDGITGAETIFIGLALSTLFYILQIQTSYIYIALLLCSCTLGFLIYNWHPALIFLGDAGSITIGYILALLLLITAAKGYWLQAMILPMYYFVDAGFVLLKRSLKLERIWEAHSEHFFQKAVRSGRSHAEVVIKISISNIILFCIVLYSLTLHGQLLLELACLVVALLINLVTVYVLSIRMPLLDLQANGHTCHQKR